ncbi:hypothetical protein LEN26_018760 [Aphanomyces euteiches]|nr:hypothetical protein LEN26_018760 [Aphanomyces euteiches]
MSRFLRAATHAGKTGVGFNVEIVLHKLTCSDPTAKETELVYPIITRGSHKVKGQPAPILSSHEVHWVEETLSFHCTMYRTKQQTFLAKPFTVDVVKAKNDTIVWSFEVDLANYTSEKNHGSNSYSLVVQPKKALGNASLMMSLATSLDTERSMTASSTTASRTQHDNDTRDVSESSSTAESPPKRGSANIVASRRITFQMPAEESHAIAESEPDEEDRPSTAQFAAQAMKYDQTIKELQAKVEATNEAQRRSTDEIQSWRVKYDELEATHMTTLEELREVKEKKAKAEKEVVLRRTELQTAMESSSRVNVVQLERIRQLTSLNEELRGKVAELQLVVEKQMAAPPSPLRHVASWSEGVGAIKPVDADLEKYQAGPVEPSNTVAGELVRLQADKKHLEEKVATLQREFETLENQLFERSSELQHLLELHSRCNQTISAKAAELAQAQEEIQRLESQYGASGGNRREQDGESDNDELVAMLQRNLEEVQEELAAMQTKNSQLRDAKAKVEAELCKRLAEIKRAKSDNSMLNPSQYEELNLKIRDQADRIRELQNQLESTQMELTKAQESKTDQVRNVLNAHFPTQVQMEALQSVRQTSTAPPSSPAVDSEVGYLKQQVRELKDQRDRIQDELNEKSLEFQQALDMHVRMQRDSVQQLNDVEAQLEAQGHRLVILQAQMKCLEDEKTTWMNNKQALERVIEEKTMQEKASIALAQVNEEVVQARIDESNAVFKAELMSLKSDLEVTADENEHLKAEIKALSAKSSFEHSDAGALRSQIQDLKNEVQHLQYELSEKIAEMDEWTRKHDADQVESEIQIALEAKSSECSSVTQKLKACEEELQELKERLQSQEDAKNDEMEKLLQERTDEWMTAKDELAKCAWELEQMKAQRAQELAEKEQVEKDESPDVRQVQVEFKFAKDQLTSCELELETLKVVNQQLEIKVQDLEANISTTKSSEECLDQIKKENEYFQTELVETKVKLAQLQEKHDDLTSEHKKIEKEWLMLKIQSAEAALKAAKKK